MSYLATNYLITFGVETFTLIPGPLMSTSDAYVNRWLKTVMMTLSEQFAVSGTHWVKSKQSGNKRNNKLKTKSHLEFKVA